MDTPPRHALGPDDRESLLVVDPRGDGLGVVRSGALHLVPRERARDGNPAHRAGPGGDHARDGRDPDLRRLPGGACDATPGGHRGGGAVRPHALPGVGGGECVRTAGRPEARADPGQLLSGRDRLQCGRLPRAGERGPERPDDDVCHAPRDSPHALSHQGLCQRHPRGGCPQDGGHDGDDRPRSGGGRDSPEPVRRIKTAACSRDQSAGFDRRHRPHRGWDRGEVEAHHPRERRPTPGGGADPPHRRLSLRLLLGPVVPAPRTGVPDGLDRGGDAELGTRGGTGPRALRGDGRSGGHLRDLRALPLPPRQTGGEILSESAGWRVGRGAVAASRNRVFGWTVAEFSK